MKDGKKYEWIQEDEFNKYWKLAQKAGNGFEVINQRWTPNYAAIEAGFTVHNRAGDAKYGSILIVFEGHTNNIVVKRLRLFNENDGDIGYRDVVGCYDEWTNALDGGLDSLQDFINKQRQGAMS